MRTPTNISQHGTTIHYLVSSSVNDSSSSSSDSMPASDSTSGSTSCPRLAVVAGRQQLGQPSASHQDQPTRGVWGGVSGHLSAVVVAAKQQSDRVKSAVVFGWLRELAVSYPPWDGRYGG
jgi:hypothetical protein